MSLKVEDFRKMKLSSLSREDVIKVMIDEFNMDINNFDELRLYDRTLKSENYELVDSVESYGGTLNDMDDDYWSISSLHNKQTDEYTFIQFYGWTLGYGSGNWEDWKIANPKIIESVSWEE